MKKLIALLVMVMSLGLSSLGLASPASDALKTEEQALSLIHIWSVPIGLKSSWKGRWTGGK